MIFSDVLIIGTGISGLLTALNIKSSYSVTLLTKDKVKESNSYLAQGGIALKGDKDVHYNDTLEAGCYKNNYDALKIMTTETTEVLNALLKEGVNFDRTPWGEFHLTREGGHTQNSILHVKDETGKSVIDALYESALSKKNIHFKEHFFAYQLLETDGRITGVAAYDKTGKREVCISNAVILATGGLGKIYKTTTNSSVASGDGLVMAQEKGCKVADMEFVQFHPTALYENKNGHMLLISEAVRGEGGVLRNIKGQRFMPGYHPMEDLAPRDVVARAILKEMKKHKSSFVYLDVTHKDPEFIRNRFPMIYEKCKNKGINITQNWIPVSPVAHYAIGGIKTDYFGRTGREGLYACGECAFTGVHGANRLASNSLLEAAVFSIRTANAVNQQLKEQTKKTPIAHQKIEDSFQNHLPVIKNQENKRITWMDTQMKHIMSTYVSLDRDYHHLEKAKTKINQILNLLKIIDKREPSLQSKETINKAKVCLMVIAASLKRKSNVGVYYRSDLNTSIFA
ncbi:MAG: L-aspartate oxidase [Bacteroidota bacterium]